jgi:hypothetical protein
VGLNIARDLLDRRSGLKASVSTNPNLIIGQYFNFYRYRDVVKILPAIFWDDVQDVLPPTMIAFLSESISEDIITSCWDVLKDVVSG